ncbi:hypothetical protein BS47DRAFT_1353302 [Hydnum rufescens UP504]|uniref:Uncharacterized protein n=1 Tax=Hydnum rufescens UP504 TaxID=1448309 RepID=A0A9P6AJN1_9AGAM|nr:hypothetical protein BS47DRAFT_1353302 [Hydnum rufescens UP504]
MFTWFACISFPPLRLESLLTTYAGTGTLSLTASSGLIPTRPDSGIEKTSARDTPCGIGK